MHRELRNRLRKAKGTSEFVAAVNADIRGFSSFFSDSSQAAAYLSAAYTHILDDYFPEVSFFKPTGDGLLMVQVLDQETGIATVNNLVKSSIRLAGDFENICREDWMINFPTPSQVGIGIARGTATRITEGDLTLDYSGLPLNLASRLMDVARPGGVVFDSSLGVESLAKATVKKFSEDQIYVRGLAETTPLDVYVTSEVVIPADRRMPLGSQVFHEETVTKNLSEIRQSTSFRHRLTHRAVDPSSIRVQIAHPAMVSGKRASHSRVFSGFKQFTYDESGRYPYIAINYGAINSWATRNRCRVGWPVRIDVSYLASTADIEAARKSANEDAKDSD